MSTFTLFWRDGKREVIHGDNDIADAMTKAGYSMGAVAALDFYANGDNHDYKWDSEKRDWIRAVPFNTIQAKDTQ